jgi:hypothetical protein
MGTLQLVKGVLVIGAMSTVVDGTARPMLGGMAVAAGMT